MGGRKVAEPALSRWLFAVGVGMSGRKTSVDREHGRLDFGPGGTVHDLAVPTGTRRKLFGAIGADGRRTAHECRNADFERRPPDDGRSGCGPSANETVARRRREPTVDERGERDRSSTHDGEGCRNHARASEDCDVSPCDVIRLVGPSGQTDMPLAAGRKASRETRLLLPYGGRARLRSTRRPGGTPPHGDAPGFGRRYPGRLSRRGIERAVQFLGSFFFAPAPSRHGRGEDQIRARRSGHSEKQKASVGARAGSPSIQATCQPAASPPRISERSESPT